jgi:hypothetical protein
MTFEKLRNTILQIFIACLVIQIIFISIPYFRGEMYPKDLVIILGKLLAIYGVHFAIVIGGILGAQKEAKKKVSKGLLWVSILLIILWNILIAWRSIAFAFSDNDLVKDFLLYLETISSASSFLIAGVLAYLFTKHD